MQIRINRRSRGFSLIEMMVVLTVVAILMAFAAPNLFSLISSSTLTGEGTVIQNQMTLAQQTAISKSADVEVRFFKFADDASAQLDEAFRAFQLYQYQPDGDMVPISEFFRIRPPVAIHENLSTLVQASTGGSAEERQLGFSSPRYESGDPDNPVPIKRSGTEVAPYVAFRFRPDGSTDLPYRAQGSGGGRNDTWYLTLVQGEGALQSDAPDNYMCLQVNPYNGKINVFRP
ncbi:MAG: Verru_Chthon cassette protein D [Verrucomicrobiales bacterium]|nr:Verru_Chthon cassette protein D [Verrucomicrobiales bacterium]